MLKEGAGRKGLRLVIVGAWFPALSVGINRQARVGVQQLKGAVLLGYEEPALVGAIPGVPLLDAGSPLTAHTVHLQALAAAHVQDAVGAIAHGLKGPQLVGRFIGLPAEQSGVSNSCRLLSFKTDAHKEVQLGWLTSSALSSMRPTC